MKKSEIYHLAQFAVMNSNCIAPENKLEIIHVLIADEDFAKFLEGREPQKAADEE